VVAELCIEYKIIVCLPRWERIVPNISASTSWGIPLLNVSEFSYEVIEDGQMRESAGDIERARCFGTIGLVIRMLEGLGLLDSQGLCDLHGRRCRLLILAQSTTVPASGKHTDAEEECERHGSPLDIYFSIYCVRKLVLYPMT
jgi:hypothetical protein